MSERNVTVHLSVDVKVEGDAPVQDIGQTVCGHLELPVMHVVSAGGRAKVTPLRFELERAHEKGGA